LDQLAEHHQGSEEEVEVNDRAELRRAAAELAVAIHPLALSPRDRSR